MAFKVTLIITDSRHPALTTQADIQSVIFEEWPTTQALQDAVADSLEQKFSDLVDGLEVDELADYEQDEALTLSCIVEGNEVGAILVEETTIY